MLHIKSVKHNFDLLDSSTSTHHILNKKSHIKSLFSHPKFIRKEFEDFKIHLPRLQS